MTELDIIIVLFCIIQTFHAILLTDLCSFNSALTNEYLIKQIIFSKIFYAVFIFSTEKSKFGNTLD